MKSPGYIVLITIGESEARSMQIVLQKEGILSELHPPTGTDIMEAYQVHGNLSYELCVPKSEAARAKGLLNLGSLTLKTQKNRPLRGVVYAGYIIIIISVLLPLLRVIVQIYREFLN